MELGIGEIIFIFVMALLLFGPKKLPEIGRTLAKVMSDFKSASNEFKSTLEAEVAKLEEETKLGSTLSGIHETIDSVRNPMQHLVARGQAMLNEAVTPSSERYDARPIEPVTIDAATIEAGVPHTLGDAESPLVAQGEAVVAPALETKLETEKTAVTENQPHADTAAKGTDA